MLDKAFADAAGGRGRTILIRGEPGIGKTTLAEAISDNARAGGANVLWGRAWEAGGAPAYWPWIQVLRGAIDTADPKELEKVRAFLDVVATLVPEIAGPGGAPHPKAEVGEQERFVLFDAISRVLRALATTKPLVLVLDDLHAVEDSSLLLLRFMARDIRTARCLLIVTHRDQEIEADPRAKAILADVARDGEVIALAGLDADAIAGVLEGTAGAPPSDALRESLHQITEGNPFYANEIMKLLVEEGQIEARLDLTRRALPVPDSVSALVLRRMRGLESDLRDLLSVGAVMGREFRSDLLARVAKRDPADVKAVLDVAANEGLVRPAGPESYVFDHSLIREALYESLSDKERSRLHGIVALTLEESVTDADDQNLSEIAHHYLRAALDDARPPFEYAIRAGTRATQVFAFEQAVALFEEALGLAPVAATSETERAQVLIKLGGALVRAGRITEATERFAEAAQIARAEHSTELIIEVAVAHAYVPSEGGIVNAFVVNVLEEALAKFGEEERFEKALLLVRLASELSFSPHKEDFERINRLVTEGLAMARRVAQPQELALILRFSFTALCTPDRFEESMAIAEEVTRLGVQAGDKSSLILGRLRRSAILMSLGRIGELEAEFPEIERLAEESRQPIFISPTAFLRSTLTMIRTDIPTALKQADMALSAGPEVPNALGAHLLQHVTLRGETDGAGDLEPFIRAVIEQRPGLRRAWGSALISICAKTGRTQEARALLGDLIEDLPNTPPNISYAVTLHFAVEGVRILREKEGCDVLYTTLFPFREQHFCQMMLAPVAYYGSVERDLATLASVLERWEEAEEHFERSLREHARVGARTYLAWSQAEYAEMMLRRGRTEDGERAKELLEESLVTAEALGLTILANFARPLLEGTQPTEPRTGSGQTSAFVVREGEYVTISWQGEVVRLRHTKGVTYLAKLLANPGREIHVLEIASEGPAAGTAGAGELEVASDDVGAALDPQAKAAYKRRIDELRDEVDEAESFNDVARVERAKAELDFITKEISAALGLGGRDRKTASNAERARVNVTKRVKETITRIATDAPKLGRHLSLNTKTGTFLSYAEEGEGLDWKIEL